MTQPYLSTMWAPTDPRWNERVRVLEHRKLGPRAARCPSASGTATSSSRWLRSG